MECLKNPLPGIEVTKELLTALDEIQNKMHLEAAKRIVLEEQHGSLQTEVFDKESIRRASKLNRLFFRTLANMDIHFSSCCKAWSSHVVRYGSEYGPIENPTPRSDFGMSLIDAFIEIEHQEPDYLYRELNKIKTTAKTKNTDPNN